MAFIPGNNYNKRKSNTNKSTYKSRTSSELVKEAKEKELEGIDKSNNLDKAAAIIKLLSTAESSSKMYMVGALANTATAVINGAKNSIPYALRESMKSINSGGPDESKVYTINFKIGFKSTKTVVAAGAQNGTAIIQLTNSLSDAQSLNDPKQTTARSNLSKSIGFNQKSFDFLGPPFHHTVLDYEGIYDILKWNIKEHSSQVPYGLLMEEYVKMKIKNSNAFHSMNLKIHVIKILDDDVSSTSLYNKCFNKFSNKQEKGCIPVVYQLKDRMHWNGNDTMLSATCCVQANITQSGSFKTQAKIVKTFSQRLAPGDTLKLNMTNHCGSGIRFDRATSYLIHGGNGSQPSSYTYIVEVVGSESEGLRLQDNSVFQGTSPCWYNYEYSKAVKVVKKTNMLSSHEYNAGKFSDQYAVRVFENNLLSETPYNVDSDKIGEPGQKDKELAIISTSGVVPVYAKSIAKPAIEPAPNSDNLNRSLLFGNFQVLPEDNTFINDEDDE